MEFSANQLAAIAKLGIAMSAADGKFAEEEKKMLTLELIRFGVSRVEAIGIMTVAQNMDIQAAYDEVRKMNLNQKKYVTGYLAAIMACDGEIADVERALWSLISSLCDLPIMNMGDALKFWKEN